MYYSSFQFDKPVGKIVSKPILFEDRPRAIPPFRDKIVIQPTSMALAGFFGDLHAIGQRLSFEMFGFRQVERLGEGLESAGRTKRWRRAG